MVSAFWAGRYLASRSAGRFPQTLSLSHRVPGSQRAQERDSGFWFGFMVDHAALGSCPVHPARCAATVMISPSFQQCNFLLPRVDCHTEYLICSFKALSSLEIPSSLLNKREKRGISATPAPQIRYLATRFRCFTRGSVMGLGKPS